MPLAASGTISIGGSTATRSINLELGRAAGATSSLNETSLRSLAGVASGAISLSNFYGKSSFSYVNPIVFGGPYGDDDVDAGMGNIYLRVLNNGTWLIEAVVDQLSWSGNWGTPTTAGVGAGKWVKFTVNSTSGSSTNTSYTNTTAWQDLTSNRQVTVAVSAPLSQSRVRTVTYLVQIATDAAGTNVVTSGTVTLTASGTNNIGA